MTPFLALAAAAGLATAGVAAEPRPAAPVDKAAPAGVREQRYCYKYEITGSILPQKTCKTLAEWKKDGVDPTARP